jgi:hypothetical protein
MAGASRYLLWPVNHLLNPVTSRIARSGHGPFSLVRHVGRSSGRTHETPVILARAPGGFVAELTYGDKVNWYRNALAAGGCVIVRHHVEHTVVAIEPLDAGEGRDAYPQPFRLVLTALRRDEFRLLRTAPAGAR